MSEEELRTESPGEPEERRKRRHDEKDGEKEEKEDEKSEKDEKWVRDPLGGVVWALILIAAGVVLLLESVNLVNWDALGGAWNAIFAAAGLILLLEVVVRLAMPAYRRSVTGTLVLACVLLAIGLGGLLGWASVWAAFLIVLGLAMILGGVLRRRS